MAEVVDVSVIVSVDPTRKNDIAVVAARLQDHGLTEAKILAATKQITGIAPYNKIADLRTVEGVVNVVLADVTKPNPLEPVKPEGKA